MSKMFNKSIIAIAVFAASTSIALAHHHAYKGERDYKGEVAAAPCPIPTFLAGPYVGVSVGSRTNYAGTPAVFRGIDGTIALGYATMVDPSWYFAGEIYGTGTGNIRNAPNDDPTDLKSNWGWGASVIPGYLITDTVLAYLRLGGNSTHLNNQSTTKSGWHVGLGGQTNLNRNWDIRAEYVVTSYGRINGAHMGSDVANLGLNYRFM